MQGCYGGLVNLVQLHRLIAQKRGHRVDVLSGAQVEAVQDLPGLGPADLHLEEKRNQSYAFFSLQMFVPCERFSSVGCSI